MEIDTRADTSATEALSSSSAQQVQEYTAGWPADPRTEVEEALRDQDAGGVDAAADEVQVRAQIAVTGADLGVLSMKLLSTVGDFKCMIEQKFGKPGPWQVLFDTAVLEHDQTLASVGVKDDDSLQLVRVSQLLFAPQGPSRSCSPIVAVTEGRSTMASDRDRNGFFGSLLLEPALTPDVAFAWVSFRVTESRPGRVRESNNCGGVNGMYFGITPADHDIVGGWAACGASSTWLYRLRDGDKRIGGGWHKFNTKCRGRGGGKGSYFAGDEITLEFDRAAGTLRVKDLHGWVEHPLTDALPRDRTLHFVVDTCEQGQGATIVCSGFQSPEELAEELASRPPPVHVLSVNGTICSPTITVSEDRLSVVSASRSGGSLFGCTLLEPALSKDTKRAQVTFRLHASRRGEGRCGGVNGLYFGITPADHDIAGGRAACGEDSSFMYRCRDGDRRIRGRWQRWKSHRGDPGQGSQGAYFEGEEITLEFDGVNRTLSLADRDGPHKEPLASNIPDGVDFYFCVDMFEEGQGATIVTSSWE